MGSHHGAVELGNISITGGTISQLVGVTMLATRANMRRARTVIVWFVENLEKQNRSALSHERTESTKIPKDFTQNKFTRNPSFHTKAKHF